jgi:(p)ppGpp synthase/HD superfamily hydrolase
METTDDALDGPALLATALRLAAVAHADQPDKAGQPYLAHPLRVAARLVADGDHSVAAGLLHDVVEDSTTTLDDLRAAGIPDTVCTAVDALTKLGDGHEQAIRRAAAHPIAAKVKAADIADNADPARLALLDPTTRERLEAKYAAARQLLDELVSSGQHSGEAVPDGDPTP